MENMQQEFIEAGTLMLAGMVFVFVFLSLLIIFINTVLSKLAVMFPDPVIQNQSRSNKKTTKLAKGETSPAIVAAISSAVAQYRKKHINK
jgi:oxaloacetate decarboxylase gamma subunit